MLEILIMLLIIIGNFILQSTVLPHINIFGVTPNTALIIIVVIGLLRGRIFGSTVGLIIGLLHDVIFCPVIGVNGFIYFFVGYFVGMTENKLAKDNLLIPFLATAISTIVYHGLYYIFMFFLGYNIDFSVFFKNVVILETLYNSLISMLIYKWFSNIFIVPSIRFTRR
ncbi:rod shape-determining protein MreD [Keratinibaculum paraultunense]|uniref:Rod shape-determining protein MreD n=1 Tax=Keratinibaculum paraultunense TaxID=1278232 RepID=A0A4R3L0P6_9FIRM|nr:rod shape-determining protein MreD [Keratinibaculum paraultunense]